MMKTLVLAVLVLSVAGPAHAGKESKAARDAATKSLTTLRSLVTKDNYRVMGFTSVEEASMATLDNPFEMYYVRLDSLRAYRPGGDPEQLLVDSGRLQYPIAVNDEVRTSVTIDMSKERNPTVGFGDANMIRLLAAARRDARDVIVQVPSLNATFIARRENGVMMLQPIVDDDYLGLRAGAALPAADVFARLVPAANRYNGLPK